MLLTLELAYEQPEVMGNRVFSPQSVFLFRNAALVAGKQRNSERWFFLDTSRHL